MSSWRAEALLQTLSLPAQEAVPGGTATPTTEAEDDDLAVAGMAPRLARTLAGWTDEQLHDCLQRGAGVSGEGWTREQLEAACQQGLLQTLQSLSRRGAARAAQLELERELVGPDGQA